MVCEITTTTVTTPAEVTETIAAIHAVHCAPPVLEYLLDLIAATRRHPQLTTGASPRVAVGLLAVSRAYAVISGRDYVTPDDVQMVLGPAVAHRVTLAGHLDLPGAYGALRSIVETTMVPRSS